MQRSCNLRRRGGESGAVLVLFIFVFFALLVVGALAIDAGNLYHARIQLQKAADAAVLAGIGTTMLDEEVETTKIETRARQVACENLALAGITLDCAADITPTYDPVEQTLSVQLHADINFLLMDAVPFFLVGLPQTDSGARLQAEAEGKRREANVALLLDVSFSMNCPGTGACRCQTPERGDPPLTCENEAAQLSTSTKPVNQKIKDLKEAVKAFIEFFDENRDRIILVPYNIAAKVEKGLTADSEGKAQRGFDKDELLTAIDGLTATSNTNICDAMLKAYEEFSRFDVTPKEEVSYVLFSDGAPTAARLLLANPNPGAAADFANATTLGTYDYMHYGIEYVIPGTHYTAPSQFVRAPAAPPYGYNIGDNLVGTGLVPACSAAYTPPATAPFNTNVFDSVFGCVANLGFHMPGEPGTVFGTKYKASYGYSFIEQYYNCAVQTSDFLRRRKSMLYAVGLGEPSCIGSDPYQGALSTLNRKDVLLSRIANDTVQATRVAPPASLRCAGQETNTSIRHPEFDFGNKKYAELDPSRAGKYLSTTDSSELRELFKQIAVKIRLRLMR